MSSYVANFYFWDKNVFSRKKLKKSSADQKVCNRMNLKKKDKNQERFHCHYVKLLLEIERFFKLNDLLI